MGGYGEWDQNAPSMWNQGAGYNNGYGGICQEIKN